MENWYQLQFQKKILHAAEKESERVQQKRVEYWSQVREIEASKLIFIDESGVNLALLRLYARALIGQRARGRKPQKRGRNISIISAISLEKVVASVNIYGAVDAVTYDTSVLKKSAWLLGYFTFFWAFLLDFIESKPFSYRHFRLFQQALINAVLKKYMLEHNR